MGRVGGGGGVPNYKYVCNNLNMDPSLPTSILHPPDVIRIISVPRPFPFFTPLLLIKLKNQNWLIHCTEEFQPIPSFITDKSDHEYDGYVVIVLLHISHRRGQAKYHTNMHPYTQHTQSCSQAFPLSIVSCMQKQRGKVWECLLHM